MTEQQTSRSPFSHLEAATLSMLRERAERDLALRRASATRPIDNSRLYAGSPMVFYCRSCGWPSDIKPEGYFLSRPRALCSECEAMRNAGWLDDFTD